MSSPRASATIAWMIELLLRQPVAAAVTKAVKSEDWNKVLKARGWDDAYLDADAYAAFLKADQVRVKDVLTSVGLVK